jgi:hypothetical protein
MFGRRVMARTLRACLLVYCTLLLSCQPPQGVLMPLAEDGVKLSTTKYANDTAEATGGTLVVKVFGEWEKPDNYYLTFVIQNTGERAVSLDFKNVELVNGSGTKAVLAGLGEKQSVSDSRKFNLYTANPQSNTAPTATLAAREQKVFDAVYGYAPEAKTGVVFGERMTLRFAPSAHAGGATPKISFTFNCAEKPEAGAR